MIQKISTQDFLSIYNRAKAFIDSETTPPMHDEMTRDEEIVSLCYNMMTQDTITDPEALSMQLNMVLKEHSIFIEWEKAAIPQIEEPVLPDGFYSDRSYSDDQEASSVDQKKKKKQRKVKIEKKQAKRKRKEDFWKVNARLEKEALQKKRKRIKQREHMTQEDERLEELHQLRQKFPVPPFTMTHTRGICNGCQKAMSLVDWLLEQDPFLIPQVQMTRFNRPYFDGLIEKASPHAIKKALQWAKIKHCGFKANYFYKLSPRNDFLEMFYRFERQWDSKDTEFHMNQLFKYFQTGQIRAYYLQSKQAFVEQHKDMINAWRTTLMSHYQQLRTCPCRAYLQQAAALIKFINIFDWHRVRDWTDSVGQLFTWTQKNYKLVLKKNEHKLATKKQEEEEEEEEEGEKEKEQLAQPVLLPLQVMVVTHMQAQLAHQEEVHKKIEESQRQIAEQKIKKQLQMASEAERKKKEQQRLLRRSDQDILTEVLSRGGDKVTDMEYQALERLGKLNIIRTRYKQVNYGEVASAKRTIYWTLNGMPQK